MPRAARRRSEQWVARRLRRPDQGDRRNDRDRDQIVDRGEIVCRALGRIVAIEQRRDRVVGGKEPPAENRREKTMSREIVPFEHAAARPGEGGPPGGNRARPEH
jgi:hypothetical protein